VGNKIKCMVERFSSCLESWEKFFYFRRHLASVFFTDHNQEGERDIKDAQSKQVCCLDWTYSVENETKCMAKGFSSCLEPWNEFCF